MNYRELMALYESKKREWERKNPAATPEQHEEAMKRIAERLGI